MKRDLLLVFLWPLGWVLGCPCCGPGWYARLTVRCYRLAGLEIPPELEAWS